jgi:hypothetical protein
VEREKKKNKKKKKKKKKRRRRKGGEEEEEEEEEEEKKEKKKKKKNHNNNNNNNAFSSVSPLCDWSGRPYGRHLPQTAEFTSKVTGGGAVGDLIPEEQRIAFIILYYDQQMHIYLTNCHTPTCFVTIASSSRELVISTLPSCTSISNAAVGNTIYN